MVSTLNYHPFVYMIYGEITLMGLTVIVTYGLFFFYKYKRQQRQTIIQRIVHYVLTEGPTHPLEASWHNLFCGVAAMHEAIERKKPLCTLRVEQIMHEILQPLAEHAAKRRFWYQRYLAAKAYTYGARQADEPILLKLLLDSHPSVALETSRAIRHLPTAVLVNALINKISFYERKNYDFYLEVFRRFPVSTRDIIFERLGYERRQAERALCYKLLTRYPADTVCPSAYQDVQSPQVEVAIAALKYILYVDQTLKPELLERLMQDSRRDLKILTLSAIANHQWDTVIDLVVVALEDADALVRLSAAKALKWLGDSGIQRLRARLADGNSQAQAEISAVLASLK